MSWRNECVSLNINPFVGKHHRPWENIVIVSQFYEVNKILENKYIPIFFLELSSYYRENNKN